MCIWYWVLNIYRLLKKQRNLSFPRAPGGGYPLGHPFIKVFFEFKNFVIGSPLKSCKVDNGVFQDLYKVLNDILMNKCVFVT